MIYARIARNEEGRSKNTTLSHCISRPRHSLYIGKLRQWDSLTFITACGSSQPLSCTCVSAICVSFIFYRSFTNNRSTRQAWWPKTLCFWYISPLLFVLKEQKCYKRLSCLYKGSLFFLEVCIYALRLFMSTCMTYRYVYHTTNARVHDAHVRLLALKH